MRRILIIFLIVFFILSVKAESLFVEGKSLFSDRKAYKTGDIITIIVDEKAKGGNNLEKRRKKGVSIGGEANADASDKTVFNSFGKLIPLFGAKLDGESDFSKSGKSARDGFLQTTFSVKVDRKLGEGLLLLKGEREIQVNNEKQTITFTGMARSDDITSNNTILSTRIADAKITYTGSLNLSNKKQKGLLTKMAEGFMGLFF